MKNKTLIAIGMSMMFSALAITGCGNNTATEQSAQTEVIADTAAAETEQNGDTGTSAEEAGQTEDTDTAAEETEQTGDLDAVENTDENAETDDAYNAEEDGKYIFSIISMFDYDFCSGVGAWSTSLHINEDGSFYGDFHDADAGESGDGYEGVVYLSQFKGQFTLPVQVSDYVYKMQIENISYENECATEEIVDGMLMKYTDAYGLEDAKDIYIYMIGAPLDELPVEYIRWVTRKGTNLDGLDSLPFCGIYNESQQEGFSGAMKD